MVISASGFGLSASVSNRLLAPTAFHIGSAAADAFDRVIYNASNGALFFDADGSGAIAQVQIATLSTGLAMTHLDIFVTV